MLQCTAHAIPDPLKHSNPRSPFSETNSLHQPREVTLNICNCFVDAVRSSITGSVATFPKPRTGSVDNPTPLPTPTHPPFPPPFPSSRTLPFTQTPVRRSSSTYTLVTKTDVNLPSDFRAVKQTKASVGKLAFGNWEEIRAWGWSVESQMAQVVCAEGRAGEGGREEG